MLLLVASSTLTMSNYSVYFLLQDNGLSTNCSVYSLTLGTVNYLDLYSLQWLGNLSNFLPAYYVTNCLLVELTEQIKALDLSASDVVLWVEAFKKNPYNVSDNGDLFVALLFMISGLCVSCWMLMLMFLLLPRYKRKPLLTHVATLLYLVVLTVIMARITEVARDEYYADSLDMIKILGIVNQRRLYLVALVVSQFLTNLAYLQLVVKLTYLRWKRPNAIFGICTILAYLIVSSIAQSEVKDYFVYVSSLDLVLLTLRAACKLLIVIWFATSLAYHTIWGTALSPRQVSYSKKLMPLAIVTWFIVATHMVITLLTVTLWRSKWLVTSWIIFLPYLLDMYILTCSWEWFYSIRHLELRLELVGMLGRRISLDDVMSFSNPTNTRSTTIRGRFASLRDFILGTKPKDPEDDLKDLPSSTTYSTSTAVHTPTTTGRDADVEAEEIDLGQGAFHLHDLGSAEQRNAGSKFKNNRKGRLEQATGNNKDANDGSNARNNNNNDDSSDDDYSYEVEYIDDDDMWNAGETNHNGNDETEQSQAHAQEGTSREVAGRGNDELPAFRPHPGYTADDYWDDK